MKLTHATTGKPGLGGKQRGERGRKAKHPKLITNITSK